MSPSSSVPATAPCRVTTCGRTSTAAPRNDGAVMFADALLEAASFLVCVIAGPALLFGAWRLIESRARSYIRAGAPLRARTLRIFFWSPLASPAVVEPVDRVHIGGKA